MEEPKNTSRTPKLAYSKREAAEATSLSVRTLDYLIQRGQIHAVKVGSRVLISAKEIGRLVDKGVHIQ